MLGGWYDERNESYAGTLPQETCCCAAPARKGIPNSPVQGFDNVWFCLHLQSNRAQRSSCAGRSSPGSTVKPAYTHTGIRTFGSRVAQNALQNAPPCPTLLHNAPPCLVPDALPAGRHTNPV